MQKNAESIIFRLASLEQMLFTIVNYPNINPLSNGFHTLAEKGIVQ